jgi:hypothetical protein
MKARYTMIEIIKKIHDFCKPLHRGRGMGWVFLLMMLSSCVNDLPYDADTGAPKLVLNALLLPDSALTATVSRTAHFLDTEEPQRLADAVVTATINGEELALTYSAATKDYRSSYTLCSGDVVTLTATHSIGTASATHQVTSPTAIAIAQVTMQPFTNPGDPVSLAMLNDVDSAMLVTLYIDDPAEETNYYRLTMDYVGTYQARYPEGIYGDYSTSESDGTEYFVTEEVFYPHYLLTESSSRLVTDNESASQLLGGLLYLTSNNSVIFSDKQLRHSGKPIIDFLMLIELPRSSADMDNPESAWEDETGWYDDFTYPADTVSQATYHYHFTLETLSESYYHYLNTVSTYEGIGNAFISEPVAIHSNVSTGVGIVGSYSSRALADSIAVRF